MQALWSPDPKRVSQTTMAGFCSLATKRTGKLINDYDSLYQYSIDETEGFWKLVWEFTGLMGRGELDPVLPVATMPGAKWFPNLSLNYAENILCGPNAAPDSVAIVSVEETGARSQLTFQELKEAVRVFRAWLKGAGVEKGDRVAGMVSNRVEAIVSMLAAASLGAIWSSCSPDFGFQGVMDRFGQIKPKILVATDGYFYGGKRFSSVSRIEAVAKAIPSIEAVVVVNVLGEAIDGIRDALPFTEAQGDEALGFVALPFDHPLYIMYSSGTTGVPKCIVHGHGGSLLQHAKEHYLHGDLQSSDVLFFFTTCGWMMWNWLVSGLLTGASIVLYDGSPGSPSLGTLWEMAEREEVTHFGTSPKFMSACVNHDVVPKEVANLKDLRVVMSTGAPLSNELFQWVYDAVKSDVLLASISGGTDILSCFMLGSPLDPVYPGEIQKRGLGMAVEAWDDHGRSVVGEKGELVCTKPFPSMPVFFYGDDDGSRYFNAYFSTFPGVWRHGDFVEVTTRGGVIVFGRSDATLNPGGVRIGTAEIDRVVSRFDEVVDSVVIGQRYKEDVRVVLFVVMKDGLQLSDELITTIKRAVRSSCTPRHVPALVVACPDIPRTISGKKVEIAVTRLIHKEPIANRDALANPEALAFFEDLTLPG